MVLTTIQKLNNAISKANYEKSLTHLQDKKVVFIFDECHRSQFGDTHKKITEYFHKSQLLDLLERPFLQRMRLRMI
ncbi:DEAD/DEAH box helicase family protein [Nonlabens xylanidelens]|uniref:DEAD/DEAH box helicase family protein n=1 Tax=Nonlabens xylanidelens TaxID=191564 RepID=UPI0024AF88A4|nr:DEAD/DEAH box helicase family protein [Nonlabens xylanidelens]